MSRSSNNTVSTEHILFIQKMGGSLLLRGQTVMAMLNTPQTFMMLPWTRGRFVMMFLWTQKVKVTVLTPNREWHRTWRVTITLHLQIYVMVEIMLSHTHWCKQIGTKSTSIVIAFSGCCTLYFMPTCFLLQNHGRSGLPNRYCWCIPAPKMMSILL